MVKGNYEIKDEFHHQTKLTLAPCNCCQFFAREDQTLRQRKALQCNICSKLPLNLQDPILR